MSHRFVFRETVHLLWSYSGSALAHGIAWSAVAWFSSNVGSLDETMRFQGQRIVIHAVLSEASIARESEEAIHLVMTPESLEPRLPIPRDLLLTHSTPETLNHGDSFLELPIADATAVPLPAITSHSNTHSDTQSQFEPAPAEQKVARAAATSAAASMPLEQQAGIETREEPAQISSNPLPRYPASWKARGLSGTVLLRLFISAAGKVERVEIAHSSGYRELDDSASQAVIHWQGRPAMRAGRAIASQVLLPIIFDAAR